MDRYVLRAALAAFGVAALSGAAAAKTLLVLPLRVDTAHVKDYGAIRDLYREALEKEYQGAVKPAADSADCADRGCAAALAASQGADEVVFGAIRHLGRKMFFSSTIMAADGSGAFTNQLGVADIEDFENATRRMARSLALRQSTEEVADLDNITEKEESPEINRRRHFYSTGGSIGYTVPLGDSYQRWKLNDECGGMGFTCSDTEVHLQEYSRIVTLGWNNWFEFKNRLAMETDVFFYAPIALGADVNLVYFLHNADISPFAGGGLGIHYVFPDEGIYEDGDKTNSGPTANLQAGAIFFRTYTINLVVRGQYHAVLNEDIDNGVSVDLALRTKVGGNGNDKYHHTSGTTWVGVGLAIVYLVAIIVSASSQ